MSSGAFFNAGPLHQLERRARIIRDDRDDLSRQAAFFLVVAWAPLVLLALLDRAFTGVPATPLLHLDLHVRWLISVPLLLHGERLLDRGIGLWLGHLLSTGIIPEHEKARFERAQARLHALRDSRIIEGVLLVAAVASSLPALFVKANPVQVWQHVVSLPLYRFLLAQFLFGWCLWCGLLVRTARLDLVLLATHPDRRCGIRGLAKVSRGMGLIGFAVTSVSAAAWGGQIAGGTAKLAEFLDPAIGFAFVILGLAFVPLMAFVPLIASVKGDFQRSYGALVNTHAVQFHRRWIRPDAPSPLGDADMSSFADLDSVFEVVDQTRPLIFGNHDVLFVLVGTLLPMLPLYLTTLSMHDVLMKMIQFLT